MGRNDGAERDPSSSPCFMLEWRRELSFTGLQIIGSVSFPFFFFLFFSSTYLCEHLGSTLKLCFPAQVGARYWQSAAVQFSSITACVTGADEEEKKQKEREKEISRHSR